MWLLACCLPQDYAAFHAPTMPPKTLLRRAFRKVDPEETGLVSQQQFIHMWENVLNMMQHDVNLKIVNGKRRVELTPLRRRFISRNAAAAVFWVIGFDKRGLMPTEVFIQWLFARRKNEMILDVENGGGNGINTNQHISLLLAGAKIIYTVCNSAVYAPPGFEQDTAFRSAKPPRATMFLEHVYGYAGLSNLSTNLFYTHRGEVRARGLGRCFFSHHDRHNRLNLSVELYFIYF
jgi:microtubule-associated protein-like 5